MASCNLNAPLLEERFLMRLQTHLICTGRLEVDQKIHTCVNSLCAACTKVFFRIVHVVCSKAFHIANSIVFYDINYIHVIQFLQRYPCEMNNIFLEVYIIHFFLKNNEIVLDVQPLCQIEMNYLTKIVKRTFNGSLE